jgi:hypothetical protein
MKIEKLLKQESGMTKEDSGRESRSINRATKLEAEKTLRQLQNETIELRKDIEDAKLLVEISLSSLFDKPLISRQLLLFFEQTDQTFLHAEAELSEDESFLKGTVSAVTTLQGMVREKQQEMEFLETDRDAILEAVEEV